MLSVLFGFNVVLVYAVTVNHGVEASSADFNRLSKDDSLGYSSKHVVFRESSSAKEDVSGLLETGLPEDGDIPNPVDSVTVDSR
jgi:hypothetical protein